MPIFFSLVPMRKPGKSFSTMKAEMPRGTLGLVSHGENDVSVSLAAVGDEDLAAVEDIVVALQNSLRLLAGSIRAGVRLGQAESAQLFAAWPAEPDISGSAPGCRTS